VAIARQLAMHHENVLPTRADSATLEAIATSEIPTAFTRWPASP
jgi:hypothetical protein